MLQSRWLFRAACLGVLLVAFQLRLADLRTVPPGLHFDEGRNMQRAWRLAEGYNLPLHLRDIPEPFDVLIRAAFMRLAGGVQPFLAQTFSVWLSTLAVAAVMLAAAMIFYQHPHRRAVVLMAGLALAVMPPAVIVGRHFYRVNWLPLTMMLALAALAVSRRRPHDRWWAVAAGTFTGLSLIFYQGGIFAPPALALAGLLLIVQSRGRWPAPRQLVWMAASFAVVVMPWVYLLIRMPNWWERPLTLTSGQSPLTNPALWLPNLETTLATIFLVSTRHSPRYHTYTTAFLNPALIALFALGLAVSLRRWRRAGWLMPVLAGGVMLLPNVISSEPYQAVRLAGVWGPLALLVGLGAGTLLEWARGPVGRRWVVLGLIGVGAVSPVLTAYHVWYHFKVQPLLSNSDIPESWAYVYRMGYSDLLAAVATSDTPVYIPVEYLNSDLAVARLRPTAFPTVRAYDGRSLPEGRIFLPVDGFIYGLLPRNHIPAQYALALPQTGEILILPPLELAAARALEQRIQAAGDNLTNSEGWLLGQTLALSVDDNPFKQMRGLETADSLAVFDGRLELLDIHLPEELLPGEAVPVTLFWRLRETTGKDYFARVQAWSFDDSNRSDQLGSTSANEGGTLLTIFSYLYPTVMWPAGEIIPETYWLTVFEDAPPGAYRFAVSVYDYPGPTAVQFESAQPQLSNWLLVGRSRVGAVPLVVPKGEELAVSARLGDGVELNGARLDPPFAALQPGDTLTLQLDWRVTQPQRASYTIFVHALDAGGQLIAQQDTLPLDGRYPTWGWPLMTTMTTTHHLTLPSGSLPVQLAVGLYVYPSLERLPVTQNGVVVPDRRIMIK